VSPRWHLAALALAALHHLEHVLRGTHVGWPVNGEVNTFTYTLAIYPVVLLGFVVRSARYWLFAAAGGLALLTAVHLFIERPGEIVGGYEQPLAGVVALAVLVALIALLAMITWRYARPPRTAGSR